MAADLAEADSVAAAAGDSPLPEEAWVVAAPAATGEADLAEVDSAAAAAAEAAAEAIAVKPDPVMDASRQERQVC